MANDTDRAAVPTTRGDGGDGDRMAGSDDWVARGIAAGRVALGLGALVAPGAAIRVLVGRDQDRRGSGLRMFTRLVGIRDLALGVATLDALRRAPGAGAARLVWLGVAADAVDAVATFTEPAVGRRTRRLIGTGALLAAAAGAWQARHLQDQDTP